MKLCLRCNLHYNEQQQICPNDSAELVSVGDDALIGTIIGERYKILCVVGRGAMGIVYKGIQISSGREMAIKVLQNVHETSAESVKRFRREAQTVSTLKHPNIVTLFDYGLMETEQPYIVTEFLHGLNLGQVLRETGPIPVETCLPIIKQVCDAVAEAHRMRIIHRDLKPDNIILQGKDASHYLVKVVDFGVAKLVGDDASTGNLTMEGKVCGSPAYMSPEQCRGAEFDYRCDIYSLGIVIFEMLTGKRPFLADDLMALMFMHVNETPPRMGQLEPDIGFPEPLEKIVAKSLSKNPIARQQSVEELWQEISAACTTRNEKMIFSGGTHWIPFAGARQPVISNDRIDALPPPPKPDPANRFTRHLEAENIQPLDMNARSPERKSFEIPFLTKAILIGIFLVLAIAWFRLNEYRSALNTAEVFNSQDRPEEAVKILEKLQQQNRLTSDDAEILNTAYLQTSLRLAKKHKYKEATQVLQKISAHSPKYATAQAMLRRYKYKRS